ncbi:MAG TPA: hypothetical protein VFE05_02775 [Longimicrobiaceae bacterium]|jgi:hypothetical protein|nr:hypothetical protein [Longimicrobiaceae bacterium]
MFRHTVLASLLTLVPLCAAAQGGTPEQRIEQARRQAAAGHIPVSLLDGKVAEGRAKGVPMDRIASVVERRLVSLGHARDAMARAASGGVRAEDLSVGADALDAGVNATVLGTLAGSAPADRRAVAIAVLTQLVREGDPQDRALKSVQDALGRGADALRSLPATEAAERESHGGRGSDGGSSSGHGSSGSSGGSGSSGSSGHGSGSSGSGSSGGSGKHGGGGPPPSVPSPGGNPDRDHGGKGRSGGGHGGGHGEKP